MTELTEDEIREIFSDKTFFKGQDYYDGGHVLRPVKIENTLYAQVLGSAATPYEVRAYIDDKNMSTECSCPVGNMCKHGVALLLQWVNDTSSFIDADKFIQTLENMNKDEIINILKNIIKQNPSIVAEFSTETGEKPEVNIKAISDKISWIVSGELDYDHIWDAVKKGLLLPEERTTHLSELYFDIAKVLVKDKPDLIDSKSSLAAALEMMSRHFDAKKYEKAREVFFCTGKLDELKSALRTGHVNRDNAVRAFLHDGELNAVIEMIHADPVSPSVIIEASSAAVDKGLRNESATLTRLALER